MNQYEITQTKVKVHKAQPLLPKTPTDCLTKAQIDKFPAYVEKWTKIGLSTHPGNHKLAQTAFMDAYVASKLPPPSPENIIWVDSPYLAVVATFLALKHDTFNQDFSREGLRKVAQKFNVEDLTQINDLVYKCGFGQHDAGWLSFHDFFLTEVGLEMCQPIEALMRIAEDAGWWWGLDKGVIVSEKMSLCQRDAEGRLHADGELAISYPDGWGIYAWHGVKMPNKYGAVPSTDWLAQWVLAEQNAEMRRILVQGMGYTKLLSEISGQIIDSFEEYELIKCATKIDTEDMVLLKMTCPSTGRIHVHRVPPTTTSAKEAISWINWDIEKDDFETEV